MINQVQWLLEIPVPRILRFVLNRLWWCSKPTMFAWSSWRLGFLHPCFNLFTWLVPLLFLLLLLRFLNQQSNYCVGKLCIGLWTMVLPYRACILKPLYFCNLMWLWSVVDILFKNHSFNWQMYLFVSIIARLAYILKIHPYDC
jgi:hypothetical protein